jgi:2-methylisocitrate lyase-like PEP mutase family enzyme
MLRELIEAPEMLVLPGVFDGFSLRLVEEAGFKAAFITGAGLSESRLGLPDIGLMGLSESREAARALAAVSGIPLIADADTGYGSAMNVFHTAQAFERAGVAGIMIEDQTWPKRCGHIPGKEVIDADEMVEKVRAALAARGNPEFVVMARTDAAGTDGVDEAIRRANLYARAGADLVFADALASVEDIKRFASLTDAPTCVNMGFGVRSRPTSPLVPPADLEGLGIAAVIYPRMLTAASVAGMQTALHAFSADLASGSLSEHPEMAVSFDRLLGLMKLAELQELEQTFASDVPVDSVRHV